MKSYSLARYALAPAFLLGVALFAPTAARADTLTSFINTPDTLSAPPLSFTGVKGTLQVVQTGGGPVFNTDGVAVTPILVSPLGPGLDYQSAGFVVSAGQTLDVKFEYKVTTSGTAIEDASMTLLAASVFGAGSSITISESVFSDPGHTHLLAPVGVFEFVGGPNHTFDQPFFAPTTGPVYVVKDISLIAGATGAAFFSDMQQNFSLVTPEPTTMASAFVGLALFGGGFWLRRRKISTI